MNFKRIAWNINIGTMNRFEDASFCLITLTNKIFSIFRGII